MDALIPESLPSRTSVSKAQRLPLQNAGQATAALPSLLPLLPFYLPNPRHQRPAWESNFLGHGLEGDVPLGLLPPPNYFGVSGGMIGFFKWAFRMCTNVQVGLGL